MRKILTNNRSLSESVRPIFLRLLGRYKVLERCPSLTAKLHLQMTALYGGMDAAERTRRFAADQLAACLFSIAGTVLLSIVGGTACLALGASITLIVPFAAYRGLEGKVRKKRRQILLELPELLNKLTLLVNAGETVQQAIHRCASQGIEDSPLSMELTRLSNELKDNSAFARSMEDFSKRCGVQEVSMFSTTVLLNWKRGGEDFVLALQELSRLLWEKRKSIAKTVGEEASSKLVFPMVLIFLIVMSIIAAPAVLLMSE